MSARGKHRATPTMVPGGTPRVQDRVLAVFALLLRGFDLEDATARALGHLST